MPRKSKEELKKEKKTENVKLTSANVPEKQSSRQKNPNETNNAKGLTLKSELNTPERINQKVASSSTSRKVSSKGQKKSASKSSSTNKTELRKGTKKNTSINSTKKIDKSIVEYYDLPYRYNETTVKILSQTPTMLFIYWDISDKDRAKLTKKYGEDFFNKTKPILVVRNKTMNYTFEVEINDFANSWYLHVNDANCDYSLELGRRPIEYNTKIDNYVYVTTSNDMEMPNNHILFDKLGDSVFFRNVKTNFTEEIPITSMSFIKRLGKSNNIYELYKKIYKGEINIEELNSDNIKLNLSSSSSSTFM